MSDLEFQRAYAEQNRRDQIAFSKLASVLSIILNLSCSLMDYFMYPEQWLPFLKLRLLSSLLVAAAWGWFKTRWGRNHHRLFGVMWYASPLAMILWMIYAANDPMSPYYAGLNIVLLAVGLLSPWTFAQNLISAILVLVMYAVVCLCMNTPIVSKYLISNETFLVLTAAIVVGGSLANARQRYREFELRWELDKSKKQLEASNQKLVELDQVKSRIFANISHELRTPLTLLIAPLDALRQRFSWDPEQQELLNAMRSNGMRLLKLINDLLDLVRLESGRMEVKREPVDISSLIAGLTSSAREMAKDKQLELQTSVDRHLGGVMGDQDKLEKIILNLVFNALKFTSAGGKVNVAAQRDGQVLVLKVSDTGIGISEKNLPFIFDRFWQADGSSSRRFQGVGIGLALVKELVEIQGGTVEVKSDEGHGSTFTVRLPFEEAELPAPANAPAEASPAYPATGGGSPQPEWLTSLYRRAELFPPLLPGHSNEPETRDSGDGHLPRILVADDEPEMMRFLESQLSRHYDVVQAVNGQEAVVRAGECNPELILLDMMMPEKDGIQACREIRAAALTRNVPIVLLTARADEETKLTALSAGASDFLAKPFSLTELHVRLKNLLKAHRYQQQLSKQNQVLESTIDQLKQTEMQLVQSEKLASLGRLSAGLIHEINNPLNFATTGLFALRNRGRFLEPARQQEYSEILQDVEDGISRVKNIVLDLRTFTHPESEQREEVRVAEIVSSTVRFLGSELRNRIHLHVRVPEEQTIWANKNKLIQVVLNLAQNSVDALKAKTFSGEERPTMWIDGRVEHGKSILVVRDNGMGISRENLDKIFDPFFTTKEVGQGMGLGLAISYRIVQSCQGKINVRTECGKFCEFTLEFPLKTEV